MPDCPSKICQTAFPDNFEEIVNALAAGGAADFAIILEGGWTRDPLGLALWFTEVISESLGAIDATVPIVIYLHVCSEDVFSI